MIDRQITRRRGLYYGRQAVSFVSLSLIGPKTGSTTRWMDEWIDGWMSGWMGGWDGWDGWVDRDGAGVSYYVIQ